MMKPRGPLGLPLFLALCGVLFSGWNAWDSASVPCLSAGCALYQSFSVGGFSLWWVGVGAFSVLGLLALFGQAGPGRLVAGLGLVLDAGLLVIMALTLPCLACLVVALLLAATYAAFRHEVLAPARGMPIKPSRSWLLLAWGLLFVLNIGFLARDAVRPWSIEGPADGTATVHVYFSPSCAACRQLVEGAPASGEIAWYPVAEEARDLAVVSALMREKDLKPFREAFTLALAAPDLPLTAYMKPTMLRLQFRLWRNKAHALLAGSNTLPFVEFHGAPSVLLRRAPTAAPRGASPAAGQSGRQDSALPVDLGLSGSCTGRPGQDCP